MGLGRDAEGRQRRAGAFAMHKTPDTGAEAASKVARLTGGDKQHVSLPLTREVVGKLLRLGSAWQVVLIGEPAILLLLLVVNQDLYQFLPR
jgi:hypothetical protein